MPISKNSFVRTSLFAVVIGLTALLIIVGLTFWLSEGARNSTDALTAARALRTSAVDLRSALQDAETGQRGYLLTGDPNYLKPYQDAQNQMEAQLEQLSSRAKGDATVEASVGQLRDIVRAKLTELKETIDLHQAGDVPGALAIVKTNRGRDAMDSARRIVQSIVAISESRIGKLIVDQQENINLLRWVALIGTVLIVFVAAAAARGISQYLKQLVAAEQETARLNVELEDRVRERTGDLTRANEEIQRFAYIVTHDLRAPLVNIMGFAGELTTDLDRLEAEVKKPTPAGAEESIGDLRNSIRIIRTSTNKMDGLINAILKLSREGRRSLKPERLDLKTVAETAVTHVTHRISEADGTISLKANVRDLVSDRMAIEQILGNIIDNAVKYQASGRAPKLEVRTSVLPGDRVLIEVEDNGRGIQTKDLERVFDLFRRAGVQDQPGEGIGLAFVRTMVRTIGGDISVRSTFGEGTTFSIVLPRVLRRVEKEERV